MTRRARTDDAPLAGDAVPWFVSVLVGIFTGGSVVLLLAFGGGG